MGSRAADQGLDGQVGFSCPRGLNAKCAWGWGTGPDIAVNGLVTSLGTS